MSDGDALFGRGDFEESRRVESAPKMELTALPEFAKKEKVLSLTLSCDTVEQRDELAQLLSWISVDVTREDSQDAVLAQLEEAARMIKRGNGSWTCEWPLEDATDSLF